MDQTRLPALPTAAQTEPPMDAVTAPDGASGMPIPQIPQMPPPPAQNE
jgi:hypothetical protein